MDEHRWAMPSRGLAAPEVEWRADRIGLWMDGELIGFPEASREILRLAERVEELEAEIARRHGEVTVRTARVSMEPGLDSVGQARVVAGEIGPCRACGETREIFEGRCHDCISAHRHGGDRAHTGAPGKNSDTPATRRSSGE